MRQSRWLMNATEKRVYPVMGENLIFAAVVGLTVFLFMRRLRLMRDQKRRQQLEATNDDASEPSTMPRLGSPGTITREQMRELRQNDFEPSRLWSREEAQLILDVVAYLRTVIYIVTRESDPPVDIQNHLLKVILSDDDMREYVREWGLNRTHADEEAEYPELERNEVFRKVEAAVGELWED